MIRQVLLVDWLVWAGAPLAATVGTVWWLGSVGSVPWEPVGTLVLLGLLAAFWVVGGLALWRKFTEAPTFESSYGTRVWTNGLPISRKSVDHVLRLFSDRVGCYADIDPDGVEALWGLLAVEFVRGPIFVGGELVRGYQADFYLRVQWRGGFDRNTFVHELGHVVQEVVLRQYPDLDHRDDSWWRLVASIQSEMST